MMQYIYGGDLPDQVISGSSLGHLLAILSSARQFAIRSLCRRVEAIIAQRLDIDNCVEVYRCAVVRPFRTLIRNNSSFRRNTRHI